MRYKREGERSPLTPHITLGKKRKEKEKDRLDLGTPLVKQNKKDPLGLSLRIC